METDKKYGNIYDRKWMVDANCRGVNPNIMIPIRDKQVEKAAKDICAVCVVKEICLEYALGLEIKEGVWGGKSESERRTMLKKRSATG